LLLVTRVRVLGTGDFLAMGGGEARNPASRHDTDAADELPN
jgi:hypothetical protein